MKWIRWFSEYMRIFSQYSYYLEIEITILKSFNHPGAS